MASEYKYDEGLETWPYFVLALLVFALVPLTFRYVARVLAPAHVLKTTKGAILHDHKTMDLPHLAELGRVASSRKAARVFNKSLVLVVVGWALVAYIWLTYAQEVSLQGFFDPHTILDVPFSATEKEIKSKYRKLTLKFHPDKIAKDASESVRKEMEAAFIRINLAYKALTDDATKENLRLYGHPEGQQDVTHGIAIPRFLVEGRYSALMVVLYFVLIGVVLPVVVGLWWSNVKARTKKGLFVETATYYVHQLTDRNMGKVYTAYDILDWVLHLGEIAALRGSMSVADARALVLQYLARDFSSKHTPLQLQIVSKLPDLIQGFIEIASVFRAHDVIDAAFDLQRAVVQACSPFGKHRELLQLPFVSKDIVEAQPVKKLGKLLTLSEAEAGKVLGIKDAKQLAVALDVAKKIPFIRVLDATFRVPGLDGVVPNSSTHLVVKFLIKSAAQKSCPEIDESRLLEEETFEDMKNPLRSNEDAPLLPKAFGPYFPQEFANSWEGFIVNQRDNKFIEGTEPATMNRVDLSNLELTQEQWIEGKEGTVVISTFKIHIGVPAPPNVGTYHFRLLLRNNAYFGNDADIPLELDVVKAPINVAAVKKAAGMVESEEDSDSESDISDPEEDSLAGALAALRGESVKKLRDDSDELDAGSVFTDIDTDTEDEG